jgi:hypothetical protein
MAFSEELFKKWALEALGKALKSGSLTLLEESLETLGSDQLYVLKKLIDKVYEKRKNVVDAMV